MKKIFIILIIIVICFLGYFYQTTATQFCYYKGQIVKVANYGPTDAGIRVYNLKKEQVGSLGGSMQMSADGKSGSISNGNMDRSALYCLSKYY